MSDYSREDLDKLQSNFKVLIEGLTMAKFMASDLALLERVCKDALKLSQLKEIAVKESEANPPAPGNFSGFYALSKNVLNQIVSRFPRRSMRTYKNKFDSAYPFPQRRNQPYKAWLKARKDTIHELEQSIPKHILYPHDLVKEEEE